MKRRAAVAAMVALAGCGIQNTGLSEDDLRRRAEYAAEQRTIGPRVATPDFRVRAPTDFTLSRVGDVWTIRDPAGSPYVSVVGSDSRDPPSPAPADAHAASGHRRGRPYWVHAWMHDLAPERAELAYRILGTITAHH